VKVVLESTTNSRAIQRMMLKYGKGARVDVQAQGVAIFRGGG
jgi:hypothetical protein